MGDAVMPYFCEKCPEYFSRKDSLHQHEADSHPSEELNGPDPTLNTYTDITSNHLQYSTSESLSYIDNHHTNTSSQHTPEPYEDHLDMDANHQGSSSGLSSETYQSIDTLQNASPHVDTRSDTSHSVQDMSHLEPDGSSELPDLMQMRSDIPEDGSNLSSLCETSYSPTPEASTDASDLIQACFSTPEGSPETSGDQPWLYTCNVCQKTFSNTLRLKQHIVSHDKNQVYRCELCRTNFSTKGNLKTHLLTHNTEKPFSCDLCCKLFTTKGNLKRHLGTHTNQKMYSCKMCLKSFARKDHLTCHLTTHESYGGHKACDSAKKTSSARVEIDRAGNVAQLSEKAFTCATCGKGFGTKGNLKKHMITHNNDMPYFCVLCQEQFKTKVGLDKHLASHGGDSRPFICGYCGVSFSKQENLDCHVVVHKAPLQGTPSNVSNIRIEFEM